MNARAAWSLGAFVASTVLLLQRMRGEFDSAGKLTRSSVAAMYAAYTGHALLTARVAFLRTLPLPLAPRPARATGVSLALAGLGLCAGGMTPFASAAQVSGTETGELVTGGVYRYSRNPQYVGYVLVLVGVGLARRSAAALGLAGAMALAFRYWVPVEERHLARDLGATYGRYRDRTARWVSLGRP